MRQLWQQFKPKLSWHCDFERDELSATDHAVFSE